MMASLLRRVAPRLRNIARLGAVVGAFSLGVYAYNELQKTEEPQYEKPKLIPPPRTPQSTSIYRQTYTNLLQQALKFKELAEKSTRPEERQFNVLRAMEAFNSCISFVEHDSHKNSIDIVPALTSMAELYYNLQMYANAEQTLQTCMKIIKDINTEHSILLLEPAGLLTQVYEATGRTQETLDLLFLCRSIAKDSMGQRDELLSHIDSSISNVFRTLRDPKQAFEWNMLALQEFEASKSSDKKQLMKLLKDSSSDMIDLGKFTEAKSHAERALSLSLAPTAEEQGMFLLKLARIDTELGNFDLARKHLTRFNSLLEPAKRLEYEPVLRSVRAWIDQQQTKSVQPPDDQERQRRIEEFLKSQSQVASSQDEMENRAEMDTQEVTSSEQDQEANK